MQLQRAIPLEHRSSSKEFVHSLKLKDVNEWVKYCKPGKNQLIYQPIPNMCTRSNGKAGGLADDALDVTVFSLSLMGKNWHEYIREAKRCLVTNGILMIFAMY